MKKERIDKLVVQSGLTESREQAPQNGLALPIVQSDAIYVTSGLDLLPSGNRTEHLGRGDENSAWYQQ